MPPIFFANFSLFTVFCQIFRTICPQFLYWNSTWIFHCFFFSSLNFGTKSVILTHCVGLVQEQFNNILVSFFATNINGVFPSLSCALRTNPKDLILIYCVHLFLLYFFLVTLQLNGKNISSLSLAEGNEHGSIHAYYEFMKSIGAIGN